MLENDIKKVSVSVEELALMNKRLGSQISKDYEGKCPMLVGLLKGCLPFMSDLFKNITIPCTIDYFKVSSYKGTQSTGVINVKGECLDVDAKDVIIVDDILDTGRTLKAVKELLIAHGAKSVKVCVLLDKPEGRKVGISADYVGGNVPNEFVVGYGLDYNDLYRNLPYVGVLKDEIYQK